MTCNCLMEIDGDGNKIVHHEDNCFEKQLAEAHDSQRRKDCAAVCPACKYADLWNPPKRGEFAWRHEAKKEKLFTVCIAGPIHELHRQETQSKVS